MQLAPRVTTFPALHDDSLRLSPPDPWLRPGWRSGSNRVWARHRLPISVDQASRSIWGFATGSCGAKTTAVADKRRENSRKARHIGERRKGRQELMQKNSAWSPWMSACN